MSIRTISRLEYTILTYHQFELACDVTPAPNGQPDDSGRDKILNGLIFWFYNYGNKKKYKIENLSVKIWSIFTLKKLKVFVYFV